MSGITHLVSFRPDRWLIRESARSYSGSLFMIFTVGLPALQIKPKTQKDYQEAENGQGADSPVLKIIDDVEDDNPDARDHKYGGQQRRWLVCLFGHFVNPNTQR
ncbi:MAG TPA: hypothetical protein VJV03_11385 [Pyrinomonadaceae bacterium]|nr:hypothetical protein [Pyrinomonadaceae bacterium]